MMRYIWLRYIRPKVWPWYYERDPDVGFRRWLRETENGRTGYRKLRDTVIDCRPDQADEWPDELGYDKE